MLVQFKSRAAEAVINIETDSELGDLAEDHQEELMVDLAAAKNAALSSETWNLLKKIKINLICVKFCDD